MKKILKHFEKADPKFFKVVVKVYSVYGSDLFKLEKKKRLFEELVESIVSQQLSVKASDAIYKRVIDIMPSKNLNPQNLLKVKDDKLRSAGLSYRKITYLKDLAEKVINKVLNLENLENMDNEEVIEQLTKVKGIGRWTAEMFLMFALARPDIFSHGDLGLRNAIKKVYGLKEYKIEEVEGILIKWTPYRTYAARILWRSMELK